MGREFEIPVSELDAGGRDYHFPVRAAWLRSILEDTEASAGEGDGSLDVRMSMSGRDVALHGRLKAELSSTCGRCLGPAHVHVDQDVTALFAPKSTLKTPKDKEYEFAPEEADVLGYEGETVVLDDFVRDEILLEIPMIPLCSEDCPGIRPPSPSEEESAKAPAIDPRLAPLLQIQPSSGKKSGQ